MKKCMLSLAVSSALLVSAVAQADATIYGSMRVGLFKADGSDVRLADKISRIGMKGTVDLGMDKTKGFWRWESRLRLDNGEFAGTGERNARLAFLGLRGDWGTAQAGRMWTTASLWTHMSANGGFNHPGLNDTRNTPHRMPNAVAYISPKVGGLQVSATAALGGSGARVGSALGGTNFSGNDDDLDIYSLAARYNAGGLHLGLAHTSTDANNFDYTTNTIAASYKLNNVTLQALWNDEENADAHGDVELGSLAAQYKMGATSFRIMYTDQDSDSGRDNSRIAVGVQHNLGKRGRVWVEYADVDNANSLPFAIGAADALSIGYRLDF